MNKTTREQTEYVIANIGILRPSEMCRRTGMRQNVVYEIIRRHKAGLPQSYIRFEEAQNKNVDKEETICLQHCDILHVGKIYVEQPYNFKNVFRKSFSLSCEIDPSSDLTQLLGGDNDKIDIIYKVSETTRCADQRYPRKMKKALKKLTMPYKRMTRLMNKMMQVN